jgi:hypothetical protein
MLIIKNSAVIVGKNISILYLSSIHYDKSLQGIRGVCYDTKHLYLSIIESAIECQGALSHEIASNY